MKKRKKLKKIKILKKNDPEENKANEENKGLEVPKNYLGPRGARTILVFFTILAGTDIENLRLLESDVTISGVTLNILLTAEAERIIIWGTAVNALIGNVAQVVLQAFFLSKVVSFGFTPIYTMAVNIIALLGSLATIYKYNNDSEELDGLVNEQMEEEGGEKEQPQPDTNQQETPENVIKEEEQPDTNQQGLPKEK